MDPEDKKLLEKTYSTARENNKILKKMRTQERRAQIFRAIKWLLIIGFVIYLYSFAKPYIEQVTGVYTDLSDGVGEIQDTFNSLNPGEKE